MLTLQQFTPFPPERTRPRQLGEGASSLEVVGVVAVGALAIVGLLAWLGSERDEPFVRARGPRRRRQPYS